MEVLLHRAMACERFFTNGARQRPRFVNWEGCDVIRRWAFHGMMRRGRQQVDPGVRNIDRGLVFPLHFKISVTHSLDKLLNKSWQDHWFHSPELLRPFSSTPTCGSLKGTKIDCD